MDLSRTNFVVYSELLLALTSLLRFNRFFVVHLWSGFFDCTVSLCRVLDALLLRALSALAESSCRSRFRATILHDVFDLGFRLANAFYFIRRSGLDRAGVISD